MPAARYSVISITRDTAGPRSNNSTGNGGLIMMQSISVKRTISRRLLPIDNSKQLSADNMRKRIIATLNKCGDCMNAAKELGIGLRTLFTFLRRYKIRSKTIYL
jgi:hypothetical protein